MLNLNLIKLTYKLTKFLFAIDDRSALKLFVSRVISLLRSNGTLFTVKYMKQVKLHITRYMVGKPLMSNSAGVSLVGGFPKHFLFLKPYIDSRKLGKVKFVLTLLNISRSIRPKKTESVPVDLSTILAPSKGRGYTIPSTFIKSFIAHFDLHQSAPTYKLEDFVISLKSGPSGPSIATALYSFSNYSEDFMENVKVLTQKSLFWFLAQVYRYARFYSKTLPAGRETEFLGRLSIVKDPDCKMRVIAILDYVSQFLLKPFHTSYFSILRKLECDRTFTQEPRGPWLDNSEHFWSLDLSAATDRLPMDLQTKLLNYIFDNPSLSRSWCNLLQREFEFPEVKPNCGWHFAPLLGLTSTQWRVLATTPVKATGNYGAKYSVGQPMGAYSSWASLAVTHHLIVLWAAHLCGKPLTFNQYILLGDDIVIKDDNVALKYIWVMEQLGVDISVTKTHVSKDTYEFAKRWIRGSNEITGIPLSGISDNITSIRTLVTILLEYINRGNLYMYKGTISELVIKCLTGLKGVSGTRAKTGLTKTFLEPIIHEIVTTHRYVSGSLTSEEARKLLARYLNQDYIPIPCEALVPKLLRAAFTEEVVKLSVNTSNKYLDFRENLEQYCTSLISEIVYPYSGYIVDRIYPWIQWMSLDNMRNVISAARAIELNSQLLWNREDRRHFQYHFAWYGLTNHIYRIRDRTKQFLIDNSSESLIMVVKNLSYLDFGELGATERDVQKVLDSVRSILFSGLIALELRRRLVAVNNNMEYILSGSLQAFVNYKSRGFGTSEWTEPVRKLSLWAPLARLDRELHQTVIYDLNQIEREVFKPWRRLPGEERLWYDILFYFSDVFYARWESRMKSWREFVEFITPHPKPYGWGLDKRPHHLVRDYERFIKWWNSRR